MAGHFYRNVFSIFLVSLMLVICCLGQDYEITAKFPIVVYPQDDFSNTSSPAYTQLQTLVKRGLEIHGFEVPGDVNLTLEQGMKGAEFNVPAKPEVVAESLYKLLDQGLTIDDQITPVMYLTCRSTGGVSTLQHTPDAPLLYTHECDIREHLSPCGNNQECHRQRDDQWLTCVDKELPHVTDATATPVKKKKLDKDLVIVLGYGAGFFALMLVFLVVYCWRKGCANRRKQRELEAMGDAVYRPEDLTIM